MLVWKLSLPSRAAVHPHRIFFCALDALAVDDRGGGARLAGSRLAALHVESFVDSPERAIPIPEVEIIVECRARRQVLGDGAPLAASAQDVHQAVDDLALIDMARLPPRLAGGTSGATCAHSASVRSLG